MLSVRCGEPIQMTRPDCPEAATLNCHTERREEPAPPLPKPMWLQIASAHRFPLQRNALAQKLAAANSLRHLLCSGG
jgi:hypothetical protein